jgi:hypothetical protein
MKNTLYILFAVFISSSIYAEIHVDWTASRGFYFNVDPNVGILGEATGNSTVAQLIYSLDNKVDEVGIGGARDNDTVIDSTTITEDGVVNLDGYADFSVINYTDPTFTAGYVYAAIFQDDSIDENDWYYYTTPISLANLTEIDTPQVIEMNTDLVNGDPIDFGSTTAQVVPEPATFLMFALGGIGAWVLRRKNRSFFNQ